VTPDPERAAPLPAVRRPRWPYLIACAIGLALGLGFAYGAWVKLEEGRHWAGIGRATEGLIIGYKEVPRTDRRGYRYTTYHPTFRYRLDGGNEVEGTVPERFDQDAIEVGRVMRLIYDPGNPADVHIAEAIEDGLAFVPWYMGGVAFVVCVPSVIGLFRVFRPRAS
jgi:hypothetical protein